MNLFNLRDDFTVELNKEEVLLIKEFSELFSLKFNTNEIGDKDGRKRLRAFKILSYVYLVYDWKSPYSEYSLKERHETALEDAKLKDEDVKDEVVVKVIDKYLSLQDTRILKLLKSAYLLVDKLRHHFESLDLEERDPMTGKPTFSAKDVMSNLSSLAKTVESLKQLEYQVKKDKESEKGLRGDAESGMFD
jgi:hypothetical protein